MNINKQAVKGYARSRTIEIVRNDFAEDRWPLGCERCRIEEQNAIQSKRQLDHVRWQHYYDNYDIARGGLLHGNEDARTWAALIANTDDSDHFDVFCKRLAQHDKYRGLDFAQTFPEMATFL